MEKIVLLDKEIWSSNEKMGEGNGGGQKVNLLVTLFRCEAWVGETPPPGNVAECNWSRLQEYSKMRDFLMTQDSFKLTGCTNK